MGDIVSFVFFEIFCCNKQSQMLGMITENRADSVTMGEKPGIWTPNLLFLFKGTKPSQHLFFFHLQDLKLRPCFEEIKLLVT